MSELPRLSEGTLPGWYEDPETPGRQRYWDGGGWTDRVSPVPAAAPDDQPAPEAEPTGDVAPAATPRRWRPLLLLLPIAALVAGGFWFSTRQQSETVTIRGEFTLTDLEGFSGDLDSCSGTGGYSDFGPGMNVVVRDGSGRTIGTSDTRRMDDNHLQYVSENDLVPFVGVGLVDDPDEDEEPLAFDELREMYGLFGGCTVVFTVEAEPSDFYAIEIGSRGELTYDAEELVEKRYYVALSLGD